MLGRPSISFEKRSNLVLSRGEPNRDRAAVITANEGNLPLRQTITQARFRIAVAIIQIDYLHDRVRVYGVKELGGAR